MTYLDIETEPLPIGELRSLMPTFEAPKNYKDEAKIAEHVQQQERDWIEKAALSPNTGSVLAVGIYNDELDLYDALHGNDEETILRQAWDMITDHGAFTQDVLGWNLLGFDLPFMVRRSWTLGIRLPRSLVEIYRGRAYFNQRCIDLMKVWSIGQERYAKLDDALKSLGEDGKVDLGGKLFYEIYRSEDRDKALAYLERDVRALAIIDQRIR